MSNLFLSDNEYELYGYYTATKLKFILILTQKINLSNYEEKLIKQVKKVENYCNINLFFNKFFKTMHEVYLKEIFNPFNQGDSSKLSNSFQKNVEKIVLDYQTQL